MIHQYIEVNSSWQSSNIEQYPSVRSAVALNGKHYTSANTRAEYPELFTGNEVVVELEETDFKTVNEE
jgi:hypothetical protein